MPLTEEEWRYLAEAYRAYILPPVPVDTDPETSRRRAAAFAAIGSMHIAGRRPTPEFLARLDLIRSRGYEMMPSAQTAGVINLSAPVLGADGTAIAALTVPYITLINAPAAPDISTSIQLLMEATKTLSDMAGAGFSAED